MIFVEGGLDSRFAAARGPVGTEFPAPPLPRPLPPLVFCCAASWVGIDGAIGSGSITGCSIGTKSSSKRSSGGRVCANSSMRGSSYVVLTFVWRVLDTCS